MMVTKRDVARGEMIARLNDRCRTGLDRTSRTVITQTCLATFGDGSRVGEILTQAGLVAAIRKYAFPKDGRSQRDRGSIVFRGETVYFAIDAYDLDLAYGSEDPSDASITRRVMTIMMRDDL